MPINPKRPVSYEEINEIIQRQVRETVEQMGIVVSTPDSDKRQVRGIYVVYVDDNPRLQVEYNTEE